jgi:dsRNA-specific ribonuclease
LTHCSVQHKPSNQRFEFLGDAILDFAVVSLLYEYQPWAKQGDLSGQKSSATCNKTLGLKGAELKLYKFLTTMSPQLEHEFSQVDTLVHSLFSDGGKIVEKLGETIQKKNFNISTGSSKALADTVEALFGAAYLDSGGNMDEMRDIVKHMDILPQLNM